MDKTEQVLQLLARMTRRPRRELDLDQTLSQLGLSSSLGLSTLRAALQRQLRQEVPILHWNIRLRDLCAEDGWPSAGGQPQSTPVAPTRASKTPAKGSQSDHSTGRHSARLVGLGHDLEEVAGLEFLEGQQLLESHFLPQELVRARNHPEPRQHLTGVFCAKEALKKSHPDLLELGPLEIEVDHDLKGRPFLRLQRSLAFRFEVSISHTSHYASAVVLAFQ